VPDPDGPAVLEGRYEPSYPVPDLTWIKEKYGEEL